MNSVNSGKLRHRWLFPGVTLLVTGTAFSQPVNPPSDAAAPPARAPADAPGGSATEAAAEPAPEGVAPKASDAHVDAVAAEVEEQMLANQAITEEEYELDMYGFADFTYGRSLNDDAMGNAYDSFAVGRLNVYLASELGDHWNSLAEVRFTYLPHGATVTDDTGDSTRIDTTVGDYTDLERPLRVGSTVIERAWVEYAPHSLMNVRLGHWLTPYGIWNVDHGSPVIIGTRRPFIVGEALLPASQTGIELYGAYELQQVQLGYHLTLSNGRGPTDMYQDLNHNKAIGGRLFARAELPAGTLTIGTSGYAGTYTDRTEQSVIDDDGNVSIESERTEEYDETSLAADLKWEWSGFLLQGEAIINDVTYDDLRPPDAFAAEGPPGWSPDHRRIGGYGLTGYRFEFGGVMPFAGLEYYDAGAGSFPAVAAFFGGFNVRPAPRVVLKAQHTYSWVTEENPVDDFHYNAIELQTAWSF